MSIRSDFVYIEKNDTTYYLDPSDSENDIEAFCDKINKDEIHPEDIFRTCLITTEDILKIYRLFSEKITNFNIYSIPNSPRIWFNHRFASGCKNEITLFAYKLFSKIPKVGNFFSKNSEISAIVEALPNLISLKISDCNDPPSCYLRLKELRHLTSLWLTRSDLKSLRYIGQLVQLEVLNLLSTVVPSELKGLTNLKELTIRYSSIESDFEFEGMTSLKTLKLIGCNFLGGELPSIKNLYQLEELTYLSKGKNFYEEVLSLNVKKITVDPACFSDQVLAKIGRHLPILEEIIFFASSSFEQKYEFNPPLCHLKKLTLENGYIKKITGIPALTYLKIKNSPNITNLKKIRAPELEILHVEKCPNFEEAGKQFPKLKVSDIKPFKGTCDLFI